MGIKSYKCERCGREVKIRSKGLCPSCRAKELSKEKKLDRIEKRSTERKVAKRKVKDPELSGFFRSMLEELSERRTSETGASIHYPTVCNVCHILPKRWYKSVAKDRENVIFLTDSEHDLFDSMLDRMDFEGLEEKFGAVWRLAVKRILSMEESGKIKERGRLIIEIASKYGRK